MKLLVGLANPGRRYARTRHNAGARIALRFAERHGIPVASERFSGRFGRGRAAGCDVGILIPETYMNLSGTSVAEALRYLPLEDVAQDLLVALDDADLPFGRLRIRPRGGSGGHKGLADIIAAIGRSDFPRLRFGVGRPPPGMDTADYVLRPFSKEEQRDLDARIDAAASAVDAILEDGIDAAMTRFNQ